MRRFCALFLLMAFGVFLPAAAQDTTVAGAAIAAPTPSPQPPAVTSDDEDLLIDDAAGESLLEPVAPPKQILPPPVSAETTTPAAPAPDSASNPPVNVEQPGGPIGAPINAGGPRRHSTPTGTGGAVAALPSKKPAADTAASTIKIDKSDLAGSPVEDAGNINFAQSNADYRSPRRALILSLVLPGLGQAYVKSVPKAIGFMAIEAGTIIASILVNKAGNEKLSEAKAYADDHFSSNRLLTFGDRFESYVIDHNAEIEKSVVQDSILSQVFGLPSSSSKTIRSQVEYLLSSGSRYDFLKAVQTGSSWDNSNIAAQGWDDCEPEFSDSLWSPEVLASTPFGAYRYEHPDSGVGIANRYLLNKVDTATGATTMQMVLGYSANQMNYTAMMKNSDDIKKKGRNILFILLANHVVSAVDAIITARAYNDRLLHKKATVLSRLRLDNDVAFAHDGSLSTSIGIRVGF